MGREQRTAPGVGSGNHAKERHKRDRRGNLLDWSAPLPPGLVARPEKPRISSKHKSWFEFIENKDKKKKLEFEFTDQREPPPGFEFVPIGNPALTTACKELSREQDAMIFIVTSPAPGFSNRLTRHLNRVGHHIRQGIVEQARASLGDPEPGAAGVASGLPEPIPEKQEDINKQADAAIRDLFPRIPNTDRQMIIEHAFNKSRLDGKGDPPVGLAPDLTLSRRVQLAVLAHIRHNHTRYDQLLRETTYVNARKAVESLCLDILVKWRGDEETGRDQLDEILCEVVVISDSESDESDEDEEEDESSVTSSAEESPREQAGRAVGTNRAMVSPIDAPLAAPTRNNSRGQTLPRAAHAPQKVKKISAKARREAKWAQRGFHRYQAARDQAWHQAVERQRLETNAAPAPVQSAGLGAMGSSACHEPQPLMREVRGADGVVCSAVELRYNEHRPLDASLPPVDLPRERASRIDELQQAVPDTAYRPPQQARAQQDQPGFGPRPIVGSRAVPYGAPDVERVGYRDLDLKDYPVQSIEPASPESSSFATRLPLPYRQPEPGLAHGVDGAHTAFVDLAG
ncbi:d487d256-7fb5-4afb-b3ad-b0d068a0370c [Thermothielavioides terrestris]|uniref:D487d256-7fb5-4afb-b3ad-b0d068a0370c n=1 Tax=Thermothielavioides terrestris TaxID=2587410 RepID=A0A3S4AWC9_9PEZI|nr:d487d256-7fb5-4afb-b3ad-b0d068a0370c [Thermothielavioides terrestris]